MIEPWKPEEEEIRELRVRLEEAEETLEAIRRGEVDALVVSEQQGEKVYTLKSADRLYRLMIEEMGQGAVTLTVDGTVLYCNRCFVSFLRVPLESVLGVSFQTLVEPKSREPFGELLRLARASGSAQGEVHLKTADGDLVPAYVAATSLSGEEGPAPLCLVVTDLTAQKAEAEAEAANQAKDHFLASLSHELRTPLTPVLALVSGLEYDARLPRDVQGQLAMVRRNLELEARLIDDLLDLTRIRRGKLELRRTVADLRQILEHAVQTVERDILQKRLRLVTDLACGDCRLWADAPRLTQVFWNLLHNAVKFTPADGTVTVRLREAEGPEGRLVVEVSDTGVGIEPEAQEHIFDAFDQGRPGTAMRFGGLGLGLAISRAIVERHGGSLEGTSEGRNRGATFTVQLPAGDLAVPTAWEAPASREEESRGAEVRHILLVEDHADTAEALAELLRGLGFQVTAAASVAAALAAAGKAGGEGGIDLVVSDLGLPDGSGLDLMRELSSRHGLKGIALSGYGMEEDIQKSREAGFSMHLTKPVSLQALRAAFLQVVEP